MEHYHPDAKQIADTELSISVVICTYGRAESIFNAIQSVLNANPEFKELIVVDQNEDRNTYLALCPLLGDERMRYIHTHIKGVSNARNLGMELATSDIVGFTDDDCNVYPDWLNFHRKVFSSYPEVDLCFGTVLAADHDTMSGYIPDYTISKNHICRSWREKLNARGIGANFAVRRLAILEMGGCDTRLGPGSDLYAAEDRDLTLRCLLTGRGVYECKDSVVVHSGFRDWNSGRYHTRRDWFGLGATHAKPLRIGHAHALLYILHEFTCFALLPFILATLTFRPQRGWTRISAFIAGFIEGWSAPIDRTRQCYLPVVPAIASKTGQVT